MCPVNDVSISAAGICTKIVQISQVGSREPDFCKILKSGGLNGLLLSSPRAFDRRTFVGNLYKQVKDPKLVGALSGHKEVSRAFARYRVIDDEMKKELVNLLK